MSPDGIFFDGQACQLSLRVLDGDVSILAGHIPYLTAVEMGECRVYENEGEKPRRAACCGGMLTVSDKEALLAPTTFEWAEDIDVERAKAAKEKAISVLSATDSETKMRLAKLKLARAEVRLKVAANK